MNKKVAIVVKNALFGFGGQFLVIIVGLIVPRMIMSGYGSETNGLLATLGQVFTYISLLGAGVSQSSRNALYVPVKDNNHSEINVIVSITQNYFNNVAKYYCICVIAFSIIGPFVIKSSLNKLDVFWVILLEGACSVISLRYIESYNALLAVDGRGYFISIVTLLNRLSIYFIKIVFALLGVNVVFLQAFGVVITFMSVLVYKFYIGKNYSWLVLEKKGTEGVLKDRNSFLVTQIAWTVFSSTDMIILSVALGAEYASVYSIYNMVFLYLAALLNEVYVNVNYVLGRKYAEDIKEYEKYHDAYTSIFFGSMTVMMCVCVIMVLPFVKLYTNGISDAQYIYPVLPILFSIVQLFSWSRYIPGNLTGLAGFAKPTSYVSIIEAAVNIVVSSIMVFYWGICGVLIGTIVALPIKVIWCNYVADRKVIKRSFVKTVKIRIVNYCLFFLAVVISYVIHPDAGNWGVFIVHCIICVVVFSVVGIVFNMIANPTMIKYAKTVISARRIDETISNRRFKN